MPELLKVSVVPICSLTIGKSDYKIGTKLGLRLWLCILLIKWNAINQRI